MSVTAMATAGTGRTAQGQITTAASRPRRRTVTFDAPYPDADMDSKLVTVKLPRQPVIMDPSCAICHAPAARACDCEARGLELAMQQAEEHMMRTMYNDIRSWVRAHAQDYVLEYFRLLSERRKNAHTLRLDRITAQAFYHHNKPPHPNEIAVAMAELKRGIDEDWQASVQRYPEVLQYFFGLVELTLPGEHEACVKDPPLSAMNGRRKATRRPPDALNNETALVRLRDRRSPFYGGYM